MKTKHEFPILRRIELAQSPLSLSKNQIKPKCKLNRNRNPGFLQSAAVCIHLAGPPWHQRPTWHQLRMGPSGQTCPACFQSLQWFKKQENNGWFDRYSAMPYLEDHIESCIHCMGATQLASLSQHLMHKNICSIKQFCRIHSRQPNKSSVFI